MKSIWSAVLAPLLLAFAMLASTQATAQGTVSGARPLPVDEAFRMTATRQADGALRLEWSIASGYYLYRERLGFRAGSSDLQPANIEGHSQSKDDPTYGVTRVFHDSLVAVLPANAADGHPTLTVTYQGCQDGGICYPPATRQVDMSTLAVTDPDRHAAAGALAGDWTEPDLASAAPSGITLAGDGGGMITSLLKDGGVFMVLGSFLLFGAALAFTPCVFPMYPILAGAIARQGDQVTALRGFTLSLAYVVAMATAFGLLGIVAAWSGQNLQMALQSPWAVGAVSVLFVILALSMFGLFELQLPSAWVNAIGRVGPGTRGSLASAGMLGFTSALIVGPCVTAPLAGALLYIAQTGDVMLGAASLFALGLGKGIPLIAFGTIGPKALPKAGTWMTAVRQAFGFVFLATAVWMASRLLPAEASLALWALLALGAAAWLGAFDALSPDASGQRRAGKVAGLACAFYGIVLAVGAASGAGDPLRPLERLVAQRGGVSTPQDALEFATISDPAELRARVTAATGRPSLLYVTADWCVTCAVIDRSVLPNDDVRARLARFNLVKLDVSGNTPSQRDAMQSLNVVGPPTMIFIDPQGRELAGTRLIGDVTPSSLVASAERAGAAQ